MLAASPMDRQNDLACLLVDISDDVDNESPEEALASTHGHAGCVPCGFEIVGKSGEVGFSGGRVRRPHRLQSRLASLHATERGFPALLKLRSDQAIIGIAGA
jgi:hypothetical protein